MSYKVEYSKDVVKSLNKLARSTPKDFVKIDIFISKHLTTCEDPCKLENATRLQGYKDKRYRWRLGNYRIIGIIKNNIFQVIQIIKISKRDERTYKGL